MKITRNIVPENQFFINDKNLRYPIAIISLIHTEGEKYTYEKMQNVSVPFRVY